MAENDEQGFMARAKAAIDKALEGLIPRDERPRTPGDVPVGDGMVDDAKKKLKGRKRAIDKAIEDAGG
jgi:hypothetical protein